MVPEADTVGPPVLAKAFYITCEGNRFDGCYADGGRVVFTGGGLSNNIWVSLARTVVTVKGPMYLKYLR